MKKLFLVLLTTFASSCCNKDEDKTPLEQLPPATQTGAGTFGCLVNGLPYVDNSGNFNCFYQLINGQYYFSISANFNKVIKGIGLGSQEIELSEGNIYQLIETNSGNFSADIYIDANNNFETSSISPGNIIIKKLDFLNNIVSANFEFTVTEPNTGKIYNITNGRFDALFTK